MKARVQVSSVHSAVNAAMKGARGDAIMFAWGMAEAVSFPVMAEMSQVWLGVAQPRLLFRRATAVVAGSVAGVALTHALTRAGARPPAPWTRPGMERATSEYLDKGASGYWKQALTGIPVKLFAAESGRRGMPAGPVLLHAAGERAARMFAFTAAIRALEVPLGRTARRFYGTYLAATGLTFGVLLRKVIRHWDDGGR